MRKRLGQHFLSDEKILRQIADLLEINSSDVVIEIGPGHGELTINLKSQISNLKIFAIEKDKKLVQVLQKKFASDKNIKIVEGDALKEIKSQISNLKSANQKSKIIKNLKIVGNIPYYITGYLLRILSELENKPALIVLTIQKEVAERICAKPPKMNLLAASVQFWAKPEIVGLIGRKSFSPPPEVDSAIIKFNIKTSDVLRTLDVQKLKYYNLIKVLFKQPRKTILNNLYAGLKLPKEEVVKMLSKQNIKPDARPQDLSVEDLFNLSVDNVFRSKK